MIELDHSGSLSFVCLRRNGKIHLILSGEGINFKCGAAGDASPIPEHQAGKIYGRKPAKKRLTSGRWYGNINIALRNSAVQPLARVVELVDSLASGASARKGVRVRLPPRAPARRKRHIACDEFFILLLSISMLGASKLSLRQGFRRRRKHLYSASAPLAKRPVGWQEIKKPPG